MLYPVSPWIAVPGDVCAARNHDRALQIDGEQATNSAVELSQYIAPQTLNNLMAECGATVESSKRPHKVTVSNLNPHLCPASHTGS